MHPVAREAVDVSCRYAKYLVQQEADIERVQAAMRTGLAIPGAEDGSLDFRSKFPMLRAEELDKLATLPPPDGADEPLSLFDPSAGTADAADDFLIDEVFSAM